MLKRTLGIVTLIALALALPGPATSPATAAPSSAASDMPNAKLLPATTSLYVDIRTANLTQTVDSVLNFVQKVTGTQPANVWAQIDQSLTQELGRPVSFAKDIEPWIGDHLTVGLPLTDEQLTAIESGKSNANQIFSNPNIIAILSIKDDTAAGNFLKELMSKLVTNGQNTTRTATVVGSQATIYEQKRDCGMSCQSLVQAKGFWAFGTTPAINAWLDGLKNKQPMLADDANFGKLMNALKPTNLVTFYVSPRFFRLYGAMIQQMAAMSSAFGGQATPEATAQQNPMQIMRAFYAAIQGAAAGLHADGKVIALDGVEIINQNALAKVYKDMGFTDQAIQGLTPKPIDAKLAAQIPAKALFAVIGGNLAGYYQGFKSGFALAGRLSRQMGQRNMAQMQQIEQGLNRFEAFLKVGFDLDIQQDILSWMSGEFALYTIYNPNSVLANMRGSQVPLDITMLVQTSDTAKTKSFLTKLNAGLQKNAQLTAESAGDNLYRIEPQKGVTLAYGLSGNTFLFTTGSGLDTALAAVKGDGILSSSTPWKNAQAAMVKPTSQIWFLNVAQIAPLLKAFMALRGGSDRQAEQFITALDQFESLTISVGTLQPDGLGRSSMQLILK